MSINHSGKTLVISSTLTVPEAKWLIQEIQAYISAVAISTLPEEVRTKLTQTLEPSFEQFSISPSGNVRIKFLKGKEHVRILILNRKRANSIGGLLFVGVIMVSLPLVLLTAVSYISSVWLSVFMVVFTFVVSLLIGGKVGALFGKRFLDLTPTSLQLEKKKVVPISPLRDGDINWYMKARRPWGLKKNIDLKAWQRATGVNIIEKPVVGINYAGKTLEIDENFTQEDAEWLVQKLRGWVSKYQKQLPLDPIEPGEDQEELPA